MSQLLLIRHGQASFMSEDYDALSEQGIAQSTALGEYFVRQKMQFDELYVGTLKRHQQTYEAVAAVYQKNGLELPTPNILPELNEHQGMEIMQATLPQLLENHPAMLQLSIEAQQNPTLLKRNYLKIFQQFMLKWSTGELGIDLNDSMEDWPLFVQRVHLGLIKIMTTKQKGLKVAAFTSGGTIAASVGKAFQLQDGRQIVRLNDMIKNASFSSFLFSNGNLSLQTLNETPHLVSKNMVTYV